MKIAITGASGHIGANLIRVLLGAGHRVRVLYFKDERAFTGLEVEKIKGSILDYASLEQLCAGMDAVIHLAAGISIGHHKFETLYEVNVKGTQNTLQASLAGGVKKFIHFSSIHALKAPRDATNITEDCKLAVNSAVFYEKTKALAEQWVLEQSSKDFDVIVLNPTGVIGPYDFKPSYMGKFLMDLYRKKINAIVPGGYDWVDARDVAKSALAAIEKGRSGERYILSGHRASLVELAHLIGEIKQQKIRLMVLPFQVAQAALPFIGLAGKLSKKDPLFTRESLAILQNDQVVFSHQKAAAELGHSPRPLKSTLKDTLQWFKENAYL